MKKSQVAVVGSTGRMGGELLRLLRDHDHLEFSVGVARSAVAHLDKTVLSLEKANPKNIDIVIDFSLAEAADEVLDWCLKNKKPLVCGTTGVTDTTKINFIKAGKQIPVLWSPNMSLGIAILNKIISQLPRIEGFDFQIEEVHHAQKKDRPSGTALLLQETLESRIGKNLPSPVSVRGGGVFGIHRLHIMGTEETLMFEHNALSRGLFAKGALVAATWMIGKPPGYYQMSDVLVGL